MHTSRNIATVMACLLPISGCKAPKKLIQPNIQSSQIIKRDDEINIKAIQIAQEFIRVAYGPAAVDNVLNDDFPPEATFYPMIDRWDVFFTNGVGSISVELDKELVKGTISRLDGKTYKTDPSEKVTNQLPLFTISEFEEIMKLPHNRFEK